MKTEATQNHVPLKIVVKDGLQKKPSFMSSFKQPRKNFATGKPPHFCKEDQGRIPSSLHRVHRKATKL